MLAAAGYVSFSGIARVRSDLRALAAWLTAAVLAALCSAGVAIVGVATSSWTAGGPDTFCYVTQADLALAGRLSVPVPIAAQAPWPNALATFVPFGYTATQDGASIAPITGIGLPLLMAALKTFGGHAAGFWVVPLSAALLVWTTFAVGRRLASDAAGAGAAWIVATSPVVFAMIQTPMSWTVFVSFVAELRNCAIERREQSQEILRRLARLSSLYSSLPRAAPVREQMWASSRKRTGGETR